MKVRFLYRLRQFRNALYAAPADRDLEVAGAHLTSEQMALFRQMHPSEQVHSVQVVRALEQLSNELPDEYRNDLWVAALMHDVGKSRYPLKIWERVMIVLARAAFPEKIKRWGEGEPTGWRRPFVIAEQHPRWGTQMALAAGASPVTAVLIRRHQDDQTELGGDIIDQLLGRLKAADQGQ